MLGRFLDRLKPMAGKVGVIMVQFEYLNRPKMPSLDVFLDKLHGFLAAAPRGYPYAIETRNPNYPTPEFFDFLRDHNLAYVFLDGYYMPPIADVFEHCNTFTSGLSVIRLQGTGREEMEDRTGKGWNEIIDPKPEGIKTAVSIVRANIKWGIRTFVNVNNHYEGSAPLTIDRFLDVLRGGEL